MNKIIVLISMLFLSGCVSSKVYEVDRKIIGDFMLVTGNFALEQHLLKEKMLAELVKIQLEVEQLKQKQAYCMNKSTNSFNFDKLADDAVKETDRKFKDILPIGTFNSDDYLKGESERWEKWLN